MTAVAARLRAAWSELYAEQRLAAIAAAGLVISMFLPWYQQTGYAAVRPGSVEKIDDSLSAFQSWGFVEASILLVAIGVLLLVWARGERRAFHLPGGDGLVLVAGGAWVMFLVFYRQIDKPNGSDAGALKTTIGVNWGIFVAFLLGALLAYAGWRMHARHRPEPMVDGDDPRTVETEGDLTSVVPREPPVTAATSTAPTRTRPRRPRGDDTPFEGQLSFDDSDD